MGNGPDCGLWGLRRASSGDREGLAQAIAIEARSGEPTGSTEGESAAIAHNVASSLRSFQCADCGDWHE